MWGGVNVNIGLALVVGSNCAQGLHPTVCVRARTNALTGDITVSPCRLSTHCGKHRGFSGCVQNTIHREGRGLCFDRVTAAGGAEYVVVSERMLSAAPPADGDRPPYSTS